MHVKCVENFNRSLTSAMQEQRTFDFFASVNFFGCDQVDLEFSSLLPSKLRAPGGCNVSMLLDTM